MNRHIWEEVQKVKTYIEKYSASLAIRKHTINTTLVFNFTPKRMATINKSYNNENSGK